MTVIQEPRLPEIIVRAAHDAIAAVSVFVHRVPEVEGD